MSKLRALAVIPSRFPSTRLPGKPLKDIHGKTLVQRVYEQVCKAKSFKRVIVASDDERILESVKKTGAETMLTGSYHETGTDRVAEVMFRLEEQGETFDLVANVQGDLPFISPTVIDKTVHCLAEAPTFDMATIATPIVTREEYERPATVKVALGKDNLALYFSRSPIPHWRNPPENFVPSEQEPLAYKHMGLYIFRPTVLKKLSAMERVLVEKREALEQLRALANGVRIRVAIMSRAEVDPGIEIDTPEDLARAIEHAQRLKI
jgi:3-deoxy-manno-octulosonate cytidylyltransferase (CMP-KDO synthetase)